MATNSQHSVQIDLSDLRKNLLHRIFLKGAMSRDQRHRVCQILISAYADSERTDTQDVDLLRYKMQRDISDVKFDFIKDESVQYKTHPLTIPKYGTNLFDCISFLIFGNTEFWETISNAVLKFGLQYRSTYDVICTTRGWKDFHSYFTQCMSKFRNCKIYDDISIQVLADLFNVTIYVFSTDDILNGVAPKEFNPLSLRHLDHPTFAFHIHKTEWDGYYQPVVSFSRQYAIKSKEPEDLAMNLSSKRQPDSAANMQVLQRTSSTNKRDDRKVSSHLNNTFEGLQNQHERLSLLPDHINDYDRMQLKTIIYGLLDLTPNTKYRVILPEISSNSKTFTTYSMSNDGNSYYRSLSYLIFGTDVHHLQVRSALFTYMTTLENKAELDKICLDLNKITVSAYLTRRNVNKPGVFAKEMEIQATSKMLDIPIVIFSCDVKTRPKIYTPFEEYPTVRGLVLQQVNDHFDPVLMFNKQLEHTTNSQSTLFENIRTDSNIGEKETSTHKKDSVANGMQKSYQWTEKDVFMKSCTSDAMSATETIDTIPSRDDSSVTQTFDDMACKQKNSFNSDKVQPATISETTDGFVNDILSNTYQITKSKSGEAKSMKPDLSSESESNSDVKINPLRKEQTLKYEFFPDQRDNDSTLKLSVKHDNSKSKEEIRKFIVERLFKRPLEKDVLPSDIENALKENEFGCLANTINRQPCLFNNNQIVRHISNVTRFASMSDLTSGHITRSKLKRHIESVKDSRLHLMPFKSGYTTDSEGSSVKHETLKSACMALCSAASTDQHIQAYYHNGVNRGKWLNIPINPYLNEVVKYIRHGFTVTVNETLYVLTENDIAVVDLFNNNKPHLIALSEEYKKDTVQLVKTNRNKPYLLDRKGKKICKVYRDSISPWIKLKELTRNQIKHTNQFTMTTSNDDEIVVLPLKPTAKQIFLSDMQKSERNPHISEYIIHFQKLKTFSVCHTGICFAQVKVPAYDDNPDTKYILIETDSLNNAISRLTQT